MAAKRRRKTKIHWNIGMIIFVVILVYILLNVILFLGKKKLTVYKVTEDKITNTLSFTGIAIRDEELLKASQSGYITYYVEEGKRIKKSGTVFTVDKDQKVQVSENQTDFIFSVIGEEFGFVGCVVLIIVFACLVYQCMNVAKKSGNLIGTYVAVGVACYMGFQSFINIAVATGTMPNTGQPLPFISYGLSSLMSASIAIGMVLNIYLQRKRH